MFIYELETKNGRTFRISIENKNQLKRLHQVIHDNKKKGYEKFTRIDVVLNGVHNIGSFEKLCGELI